MLEFLNWQAVMDAVLCLGLAASLLSGRVGAPRAFAFFVLIAIISGRVPFDQSLNLLTSPAIIAVTALMIVSVALSKIPGLPLFLFGSKKRTIRFMLARFLGAIGLISAVVPNTAVVGAAMGPASRQAEPAAGKILLPLSYMALAGGMLTPFGTSANLLVVAESARAGVSLSVMDFVMPGGLTALAVFVTLVAVAPILLRHNQGAPKAPDDAYYIEAQIPKGSSLSSRTVTENALRHLDGVFLAEVVRSGRIISPVRPDFVFEDHDRLIFVGDLTQIETLRSIPGLALAKSPGSGDLGDLTRTVIAHNSVLVGNTLRGIAFRARFDASVIAIRRGHQRLSGKLGEIRLKAGDVLILATGPDFSNRTNLRDNFYHLDDEHFGHAPLGKWQTVGLVSAFAAFLTCALAQLIPFEMAALLLAGVCVLSRWILPREARRAFPFDVIVILWGATVLSEIVRTSGAAAAVGTLVAELALGLSPVLALIIIFTLAWALSELFSNATSALTTLPIALETALHLDLPLAAFALAAAFGASASFIIPFGYQTHLMIMTPGAYRLRDFARLGSVTIVAYAGTSLAAICLLYSIW